MIEMLPDLLRGSITSIYVILIMLVLARPKYSAKKTMTVMFLLITVDFTRDIFCYIQKDYTLLAKLDVLFLIIVFVFAKPFFKESVMQWIFNCVTTLNIYASVVFISYLGCGAFPFPLYANTFLRIILFSIILFFMYRFGRIVYREVKRYWYIFLLPAVSIFAAFVYIFVSCEDVEKMMVDKAPELLLLIIIAASVYLSTFYSMKVTSEKAKLQEDGIKNCAREELLQAEIRSYEEVIFMTKRMRHDLRHHNAVLLEYLTEKNIEGAKEYLNEQSDELVKTSYNEYCKNPVANAIFRIYQRRADSLKITYKVFAQIPKELPLTAPEFGAVLSNLLENAYESCEKTELPDCYITVRATAEAQHLLIELRNTVSDEIQFRNGMPLSTKNDGGTGIKSIYDIINKYHGMVEFMQCQTEFTTRIILPL